MVEIDIKNDAKLKIFINDIPSLKNIPNDIMECLLNFLSDEIYK